MARGTYSGLVTPEAVVLQFRTAGVGSRGAAMFLDFSLQLLTLGLVALAAGVLDSVQSALPSWAAVTFLILVTFLVLVAYPAISEALWRGKTLGKAAFGLRVVTKEGGPVTFRHTALRAALAIVEVLATFGAIAIFVSFLNSRNQRLGDMVAGTLVVRERTGESIPTSTPFQPPNGAEEYTRNLNVAGLSSDDYLVVRTFLLRSWRFRQQARHNLAHQLANQMAHRLSVTPDSRLTPEGFLACVASAYQERFRPV